MSAFAQFDVSYSQAKPYLTIEEYQNAPTAIDTANLIPTGSLLSQDEALAEVIARASSLLDAECMGAWGTLCATRNTENARIWASNNGSIVVHPKYWPILEVSAFSVSSSPSAPAASVTPQGNVWIEPSQFIVQPGGVVGTGFGGLGFGRGQVYCSWQYVNGWPNTSLSASVAAGAASVSAMDPTGIYPGTGLELFDAPNDEMLVVASDYVPGGTLLPLTHGLSYDHLAGTTLSNLPTAAKQAAISMVTCLVKIRGSGALIVDDIGEARRVAGAVGDGAIDDWEMAMRGIRALRQMYVGY